MLIKDVWLSNYFPDGAWRYVEPFDFSVLPKGFISSKVPAEDINSVNILVSHGFKFIEVLVNFIQKEKIICDDTPLSKCHFVSQTDKEQVVDIARNAFSFSRLYHDERISKNVADQIKADWVSNYFEGRRGTQMIVCKEGDSVSGFMLLINNVIDLIAVDPNYSRQGIATKMIAFANSAIGLLIAGTQLTNKPSIALYQKSRFFLQNSTFVLHKHS